jgi:hypothetical protein
MTTPTVQWIRKVRLTLLNGQEALDLSEFRFTFSTVQADYQSPNNCQIRVFNLKTETSKKIRGEFSDVILEAGYEGNFGIIFRGTVKQFRIGKENSTDSYLDILSADGDTLYNFGFVSRSFPAGSTAQQRAAEIVSLGGTSDPGGKLLGSLNHNGLAGTMPAARGKVVFALMRAALTAETGANGATWNINDGKVNIIPLDGYLPSEAVVLTARTGLLGIPEQTNEGIRARCLLNPLLQAGALVQIDNASINQTVNADQAVDVKIPYNQWTGIQFLADTSSDGIYRILIAEHEGDSRGQPWYTNLTALAINPATKKVVAP